jgi:uncharacterized protein (TIRG00374 family)
VQIHRVIGKKKLKQAFQVLLSLFLGLFIFWLVYKDLDFQEIRGVLRQANYFWVLLPLLLGLFSHFIRALRWKMLIEPLGKTPKLLNVFCAVMVGYFANLLFPRAGEVARCGVIKQYEGISFSELLGTVIAERAFDLLVLLMITFSAVFLQLNVFIRFFETNPEVVYNLYAFITNPILWIIIGVSIIIIFIFWKQIKNSVLAQKGKNFLQKIWNGFKTFFRVKNKPLFLLYTVLIWIFYFLMFYLSFFAFDFTKGLSLLSGLSGFVMSSFGIVAPVQGGIGAFHFMVIECLQFYGVERFQAAAFAFVIHIVQTIMFLIVGFICFVSLSLINKNTEMSRQVDE